MRALGYFIANLRILDLSDFLQFSQRHAITKWEMLLTFILTDYIPRYPTQIKILYTKKKLI